MSDSISACCDAEESYVERCREFNEQVQYRNGYADWSGTHAESLRMRAAERNKAIINHIASKAEGSPKVAVKAARPSEGVMDVEARVAAMVWCEACEAHGVYVRPVRGGDRIDCSKCGAILGATLATLPKP